MTRSSAARRQTDDEVIEAGRAAARAAESLDDAARNDPAVFCASVLRDEQTGRPIRLAPMHVEWQDTLTTHSRVVIWTHTEAGKTSAISVGRTLWEIGKNPGIRILILSNASGGPKKIVKAIKSYIERSREYRRIFPNVIPDKSESGSWREDSFHVVRPNISKDPTVQAAGFEGDILGGRYDLIIIDDYLNAPNTHSDVLREKYHSWLKSTIESRRARGGRLWFIGNAWHEDDAMHRYAKELATYAKKYPVRNELGESSWPEVWTQERIDEEIANRGPIEAPRSLFCAPVDDAERRFKSDYVKRALELGNGRELMYRLSFVPAGYRTITGVDLASSKKKKSDRTALVTIAVEERTERRHLLDITSGKMSGPEIVAKIKEIHSRYHSIVVVESNACFPAGTPVLTRERGYVPIEDVQSGEHTWTHRTRWRRVTEVISGRGRRVSPTRASGSLEIVPTSNHWFYMREAGRTPGRGGGHHRPVGDAQWISAGFADRPAYAAIAVPRWPTVSPLLTLPATRRTDARAIEIDEEIAFFLGLYMAEGCGGGLRGEAQTVLTLSRSERYLATWAARVMRRLAPERAVSVSDRRATLRVRVSSTALGRALARIGKGPTKSLPVEWLGWPLHLRIAAVRGWLVGDGSYTANNVRSRSRSTRFVGSSISRNWVMWARSTLLEAGLRPVLAESARGASYIEGRCVTRRRSYSLTLSTDDSDALIEMMSFPVERRRWRLDRQRIDRRTRRGAARSHHSDGHLWSYVVKGPANFEAVDMPVYNLIVDEDHSYTANDYVVHNAQAYIKQFLDESSAVPVRAFYTGKNKIDPTFGLESIAVELSQGKWVFPNDGGTLEGRIEPEVLALIGEMLRYDPRTHPGDRLMAMWFAREGARFAAGIQQGKRPRRT